MKELRFYKESLSYWKTGIRNPLINTNSNFYVDDILRELYIIDRYQTNVPSATEIRTMIETRSNLWKKWVPEVNHTLVENCYPDYFRVRIPS